MELLVRRTEIRSLIQRPSHDGHDGDLDRLLSRREREEALRQRNYEHKNAPLAPAVQRDGPHYPHVYKTHSAGNVLAASGKKYTLPVGSQRKENNVGILKASIPLQTTDIWLSDVRGVLHTGN